MATDTRVSAKEQGLKHFFTGDACSRGHICERFVSDGTCKECRKQQATQWRVNHPCETKRIQNKCNAKRRESQREYRQQPEIKAHLLATKKAWANEHREKARACTAKWRDSNKHKVLIYRAKPEVRAAMREASRRWYQADPSRAMAWAKNNPDKRRDINGRRYAKKKKVMVAWANKEAIAKIYAEAERLTVETGIPHEVDHIYPIQGKTVTGLHHESNLRVVPWYVNRAKGNKLPEVLI